jgi:site-specific DNA-methyltransferase (adenine-specific)
MNQRKRAFLKGLQSIKQSPPKAGLSKTTPTVGVIKPRLYNTDGMPETNQIIQGDSIQVLNDGPEGWVDLVFADPPFNIGYLYHGYDDHRSDDEYLAFSKDWMSAVYRALKPGGSFYLAIGDEFAADLAVVAKRQVGFTLRNWIIWHYTFGQQPKNKFARSHTHILYFVKDPKQFTFNPDDVRVASARQTTYNDSRANPKGKLPDDVWFLRPQEAAAEAQMFPPEGDTWNVSRICGTFKEREGWHGCQMPMAVLDRIIRASSNPGDVVLDPFNGSGTTVVSAALLGRKYVGIDQSEEYVGYARKRMEHALSTAATPAGNGKAVAAVIDPKRSSKVMTETDAFGRKRVARGRRAVKSA